MIIVLKPLKLSTRETWRIAYIFIIFFSFRVDLVVTLNRRRAVQYILYMYTQVYYAVYDNDDDDLHVYYMLPSFTGRKKNPVPVNLPAKSCRTETDGKNIVK